jgi:DNA polymerase
MGAPQTATNKLFQYQSLVEDRKKCILCTGLRMTNPSRIEGGKFDSDQIGPWTQWQGDINADLMIVAQDWGGDKYFKKHKGKEEDNNATNRNLVQLLDSIGFPIALPTQEQTNTKSLFFTNAVLCCKEGGLTAKLPSKAAGNCSRRFLARQIELVRPKVVVTLGHEAYRSVCYAYCLFAAPSISDAIADDLLTIGYGTTLVPVRHCGHYGTSKRKLPEHRNDWLRVAAALKNWEFKATRLACGC